MPGIREPKGLCEETTHLGERSRYKPQGETQGGQDLFITFCVDAKSSERPCSAEQRTTLNALEVCEQTFLPLYHSPHLGPEQVYSNSLHFSSPSKYLLLAGFLTAAWQITLKRKIGRRENMAMVMMIACGIPVLFLYTPSSIIRVYLTLRLHFVAHYGGRGRWF